MTPSVATGIVWLLVNLVAMLLYVSDKQRAKQQIERIPETTLLGIALIGGALGALLGMILFRHKTRHTRFVIAVPFMLLVQLALFYKFIF